MSERGGTQIELNAAIEQGFRAKKLRDGKRSEGLFQIDIQN